MDASPGATSRPFSTNGKSRRRWHAIRNSAQSSKNCQRGHKPVSDRELRVPGEQPGTFRVVAESARVERGWHELVARRTDDAKRAYRRLSDSPLERYPGRQFPLRGKLFAGVWE